MSTSKYPHGGEHGGDEPIYVDNINDPRLKRYLAEMHLFNEAQAYKPFEGIISEEEYKKGQEALESIRRQGDRFDYSWMTDRDKYEKAYGTIWSGYESDQGAHETGILNWPKPSQRVVHRVPDVVLPIKKIERKEPQLIQRENVPVQKPVYETICLLPSSSIIV